MQKLTMQEMQESFVQIEFSKMELLGLSSLYTSGLMEMFSNDPEAHPAFADRLEACGNAFLLALEGVDEDSVSPVIVDNAEIMVKLLEKLSLILANSLQIKH